MTWDRTKPIHEQIAVDEQNNLVRIFDRWFAAELFETLTEPTPHGHWFRVVASEDGKATTVHVRRDLIVPNTN